MLTKTNTPQIISVLAPAKINLWLDILARREDGYHDIVTLFQSISLQDMLTFKFLTTESNQKATNTTQANPIISLGKLDSSIEPTLFPLDQNNSIAKAFKIFLAHLDQPPTVTMEVKVQKDIPIAAGLAGGSTDAAATLVALNYYFNKPFSKDELVKLASQIGSDVAFCLIGGLAVGRGRGEQLEKVDLNLDYHFILVKPRSISISTPWAYKMYDELIESSSSSDLSPSHSVSDALLALRFNSALDKQSKLFWNALEPIIFKEYPILAEIKNHLLELGCAGASLAGSGPTIYGLVRSEEDGFRILEGIRDISIADPDNMSDTKEEKALILDAWLTESIGCGIQILADRVSRVD